MAVPNDPLTDFGHDLSNRDSKKISSDSPLIVQLLLVNYWSALV